jgi:hypothetical protein
VGAAGGPVRLAAAAFTFRSFLLWLWFSFFAIARKNEKSNVNKFVMENEPLVGSNIFYKNQYA